MDSPRTADGKNRRGRKHSQLSRTAYSTPVEASPPVMHACALLNVDRRNAPRRGNIMRSKSMGFWLAGSAVACLMTSAAFAEGIETVTVTAEKRAEDIQKVPVAVTAI